MLIIQDCLNPLITEATQNYKYECNNAFIVVLFCIYRSSILPHLLSLDHRLAADALFKAKHSKIIKMNLFCHFEGNTYQICVMDKPD